jgi:segregation and condensation protein B
MSMQVEQLKQVVEVLVFASDIPLPAEQIRTIVEETTAEEISRAVEELNNDYRRTERTFQIVHIGGGYQMVTHENYAAWVKKLFQGRLKQKLSQAALETLSVIAFRQPVAKPDIEAIRGVNCDGVIRTLLERKLVTIAGRADGPGKPLLLKTTKEFLRHFGVNDISDLPKPKEIEELFKENGVQGQPNPLAAGNAPETTLPETTLPEGMQQETGGGPAGEDAAAPGQEAAIAVEDAAAAAEADVSDAIETGAVMMDDDASAGAAPDNDASGGAGEDSIARNPAPAPSEAGADHAAQ